MHPTHDIPRHPAPCLLMHTVSQPLLSQSAVAVHTWVACCNLQTTVRPTQQQSGVVPGPSSNRLAAENARVRLWRHPPTQRPGTTAGTPTKRQKTCPGVNKPAPPSTIVVASLTHSSTSPFSLSYTLFARARPYTPSTRPTSPLAGNLPETRLSFIFPEDKHSAPGPRFSTSHVHPDHPRSSTTLSARPYRIGTEYRIHHTLLTCVSCTTQSRTSGGSLHPSSTTTFRATVCWAPSVWQTLTPTTATVRHPITHLFTGMT